MAQLFRYKCQPQNACYNDKTQQTDTSFYYSSRGTILHLSTKLCMTRLQQSVTRGRLTLSREVLETITLVEIAFADDRLQNGGGGEKDFISEQDKNI